MKNLHKIYIKTPKKYAKPILAQKKDRIVGL
jgi:hypothetical protein